jgi:hypothetical protein
MPFSYLSFLVVFHSNFFENIFYIKNSQFIPVKIVNCVNICLRLEIQLNHTFYYIITESLSEMASSFSNNHFPLSKSK